MHARVPLAAAIALAVLGLTACGVGPAPQAPATPREAPGESVVPTVAPRPPSVTPSVPTPDTTPTPSAAPATPDRITVTISGDLLWHRGLLADGAAAGARVGADYDFVPLFEHVRPLIEDADVSICHVEVPIAPKGVKPTGYPTFASPAETLAAAAEVGFDYCTTASNHTNDRGVAGRERTLDVLDDVGIVHTGSYRTREDAGRPALLTTDAGVRVAVVAGAYGMNGGWPREAWAVDRLDAEDMVRRGREAREAGADLVLAAMHAGTEQRHQPNAQQVEVATELASSGVFDLVYGHHAHVAQPWDRIDGTWVAYGGGNFVAQMKVATPRAYEQYLGRLTFVRDGDRFRAERAEYVPLMMTLSRPGAPARVLDVNRALREGTGDAERLRTARDQVARAVNLLDVQGLEEATG